MRFSMPWSSPAKRMREFILAMRAIWAAWHNGERLDFKGDFYTHTLMTPMFTPTDNDYGAPKVLLLVHVVSSAPARQPHWAVRSLIE